MHFRGLLIGSLCVLSLAACNKEGTTVKYDFTIDVTDSANAKNLMESAERVLARKLAAADIQNVRVSTVPDGDKGGTVTVELPNAEARNVLDSIVNAPFNLDIRVERTATTAQTPNTEENWMRTGLDKTSVAWVQAVGDRTTGAISLDITFNESGKKLLKDIFAENKGKNIGIFVRDLLVSKLKIESADVEDRLLIEGVPSAKVAEIFADDVNVGLHVTFSPAR